MNKVYWNTAVLTHSCAVLGCFHATSSRAEFAGDCLVHMQRTLALCGPLRKGLWTPGLISSSLELLCVCHILSTGFHLLSICDSFCIFSSELSSSSFTHSVFRYAYCVVFSTATIISNTTFYSARIFILFFLYSFSSLPKFSIFVLPLL